MVDCARITFFKFLKESVVDCARITFKKFEGGVWGCAREMFMSKNISYFLNFYFKF